MDARALVCSVWMLITRPDPRRGRIPSMRPPVCKDVDATVLNASSIGTGIETLLAAPPKPRVSEIVEMIDSLHGSEHVMRHNPKPLHPRPIEGNAITVTSPIPLRSGADVVMHLLLAGRSYHARKGGPS